MTVPFDDSELLDLIEGDLDGAAAAALRRHLADDPQMLARIARLENDRYLLRSLPEPPIPSDLSGQLESLLARPMLIEPVKPGLYRRQQRRMLRRHRVRRLAAAASVALAVSAGVWLAASFGAPLLTKGYQRALFANRGDADNVASSSTMSKLNSRDDTAPRPVTSAMTVAELAAITESDDAVHHYRPLPVPMDGLIADNPGGLLAAQPAARTDASPSSPTPVAAPFAIVVQAKDASSAEQMLAAAVMQAGRGAGLVRNFSFAEARQIEEEWRLANAGQSGESSPMVADVGRRPGTSSTISSVATLANRVRERLNKRPDGAAGDDRRAERSGIIIGAAHNAPTLEMQLEFSGRGATHTTMVAAADLARFLDRVSQDTGFSAMLRMMPPTPDVLSDVHSSSAPPLREWLQQAPNIRSAVRALLDEHGETAMVLVPVAVKLEK